VVEHLIEFFLSEDSAEFTESKERNERAEDDDGAADELVQLDLVEDGPVGFVMDEALDELFQEVKGEDEQAKDDRLQEDGLV
jgi:hypothetical protein